MNYYVSYCSWRIWKIFFTDFSSSFLAKNGRISPIFHFERIINTYISQVHIMYKPMCKLLSHIERLLTIDGTYFACSNFNRNASLFSCPFLCHQNWNWCNKLHCWVIKTIDDREMGIWTELHSCWNYFLQNTIT